MRRYWPPSRFITSQVAATETNRSSSNTIAVPYIFLRHLPQSALVFRRAKSAQKQFPTWICNRDYTIFDFFDSILPQSFFVFKSSEIARNRALHNNQFNSRYIRGDSLAEKGNLSIPCKYFITPRLPNEYLKC